MSGRRNIRFTDWRIVATCLAFYLTLVVIGTVTSDQKKTFHTFTDFKAVAELYRNKAQNYLLPDQSDKSISHKLNYPRSLEERLKRNAPDNIKKLSECTTIFAHISNGISLQSGLLNNTIQLESAVQELLNIASINIAEFKESSVKEFTSKVTDFKEKPSNDELNTMLDTLEKIQINSEGLQTLDGLKEVEDYFNKIVEISGFDFSTMTSVSEQLATAATNLEELGKIKNPENATPIDLLNNLDAFKGVFSSIQSLNSKLLLMKSVDFEKFDVLESAAKALQPFKTVIDLMKKRATIKTPKVPLNQEIDDFLALKSSVMSTQLEVNRIFMLIDSRTNPTRLTREFTSGFSNGVTDLNQIGRNLGEECFVDAVGQNIQKLRDGLKPLALTFSSKMTELNGKFSMFSKDSGISDIRRVQQELLTNSITKAEADKVIKVLESSAKNHVKETVYKPVADVIAEAESLAEMIKFFREWSEHLLGKEFSAAIKEFENELSFTKRDDDTVKAEIPRVFGNLKEKKSIEAFLSAIKAAQDKLSGNTDTGIKEQAAKVTKDTLTAFKDNKDVKNELALYTNIRDQKANSVKLVNSIRIIGDIRKLDQNQITTLESLAGALTEAKSVLDSGKLKQITDQMKKDATPESRELTEIMKPEEMMKTSKVIGDAANGLQNIQNFMSFNFNAADESVKNSLQKVSDKNKNTEIANAWDDMNTLKALHQKINDENSKLVSTGLKNVSDFGPPIANFEKLDDVVLDQNIRAVDMLLQESKDPTDEIKLKAVKGSLESLDLKFSNHKKSFVAAPTTFKTLETFFTKFFQKKKDNDSAAAAVAGATTEEPAFFLGMSLIVVIIVSCLLLLLILAAILIPCFCCSKCPIAKRRASKNSPPYEPLESKDVEEAKEPEKKKAVPVKEEPKKENTTPAKVNPKEEKVALEKRKEKIETKKIVKVEENPPLLVVKKEDEVEVSAKDKTESTEMKTAREPKAIDTTQELVKSMKEMEKEKDNSFKKEKAALPEALHPILKWVIDQKFNNVGTAILFHFEAMQGMYIKYVDRQKDNPYLVITKNRGTCLNPNHVVSGMMRDGQEVHIHANVIKSPSGFTFIATQAPLDKDEGVKYWNPKDKSTRREYDDTREDFWLMVITTGAERIVMLCNFMEVEISKCGKYFSDDPFDQTIEMGRYVVETVGDEKYMFDGDNDPRVIVRNIEVTDKTDPSVKRVLKHYHVIDWPDASVPPYPPNQLWRLMDEVKKTEKPVVVHCSAGIGRTMVFIGMDVMAEEVQRRPTMQMPAILDLIREYRWSGIQTVRQSYYLQVAILYKIVRDNNLKMSHYNKRAKMLMIVVKEEEEAAPDVFKTLFEKRGRSKQLAGRQSIPY